jgi:secreted Zn-dependent insulinase-like peptidase
MLILLRLATISFIVCGLRIGSSNAFLAPQISWCPAGAVDQPSSSSSSRQHQPNHHSSSLTSPSALLLNQQSNDPALWQHWDYQHSNSTTDDARRRLVLSILAGAATPQLLPRLHQERPDVGVANAAVAADSSSSLATAAATELYFRDIIKPPLDTNEYVTYTLDNGLRVLLCSDPTSNQAAAAMDVHVGACSDPVDVPGLAHFTEHMLFLGTTRYPKEDSFESFLAGQGGSSNAFTDAENTVYYFTLGSEELLAEGLSRFGSFFSSPLFTESATSRELNAIESENAKNLQSDIFRNYQLTKGRANPDHPFSKFFTGNKYTLLDATKEKGINVRDELIKFYNRYYSANQMTLAVVGPQSIPDLQKMVKQAFSDIPNRNVGKPEQAWAGTPPFLSDNSIIPSFQHVVEIVPVSDLRQVVISWPMQYMSDRDRDISLLVKPSEYVGHLLGHEGPSSLLSNLKRRGYANSLGCAAGEELSDFEVFDISIGLTTQGLTAVDKVVEAVYSYLRLLKENTIPDYVLKEVLQLQELQWRYLTKGAPGGCKFRRLTTRRYLTLPVMKMHSHCARRCKGIPQHCTLLDREGSPLMNMRSIRSYQVSQEPPFLQTTNSVALVRASTSTCEVWS